MMAAIAPPSRAHVSPLPLDFRENGHEGDRRIPNEDLKGWKPGDR